MGLSIIPAGAWADEAADERELQAAEREMTAVSGSDQTKVNALATQYDVDPAVVQQMRDKNQGWGEISIQLAMARQLTAKDPTTYPTQQAALDKVRTERAGGAGYGRISKDLGFKLGPVISDAKRSKTEIQSSAAESERSGRPEPAEKKTRVERERIDRTERPMRMERPERPEHPAHPEKSGR